MVNSVNKTQKKTKKQFNKIYFLKIEMDMPII
jgi:hypothetical protein